MGDTFDKMKKGLKKAGSKVEDTAKDVVDPDTYTGSDKERERRDYNEAEGKEPMNPENIASHEPTAVKRDQGTDIAEEGQTGTSSPEAREKYKKTGMTDTK